MAGPLPRFQFVFQGGGAKLALLMAAAQAIFELSHGTDEEPSEIEVSRVAGASAGAIAACMLTSGTAPEAYRVFLRASGAAALRAIRQPVIVENVVDRFFLARKVLRGKPLYNVENYKNFLRKMFKDVARVEHVDKSTLVFATDIKNGAPKFFDGSTPQDNIADALFNSSALPFIFSTFGSTEYCDGGLINNFPSHGLNPDDGEVIGFSFPKSGQNDHSSFVSYSLALIYTAMDVSVAKALDALPKQNVYTIESSLGMLDFDEALKFLADDGAFQRLVDDVKRHVRKVVDEQKKTIKMMNAFSDAPDGEEATPASDFSEKTQIYRLVSAVNEYHSMVLSNSQYEVVSKALLATCNGLAGDTRHRCDDLVTREIIVPRADVHAYLATIITDSEGVDLDRMRPRVRKAVEGKFVESEGKYKVVPIRIPDSFDASKKSSEQNLMLFIHPPLKAEAGVSYEIRYSLKASNILSEIRSGERKDYFVYQSKTATDYLIMAFFLPEEINIELSSMGKEDQVHIENLFSLSKSEWVTGAVTGSDALSDFDVPPGMKPVGWCANRIKPGQTVGLIAKG